MIDHTIVDWRPYSFFTEEVRPRAGVRALLDWRLGPRTAGRTSASTSGCPAPLPGAVRRRICRPYAEKELRADLARLEQAMLADAA